MTTPTNPHHLRRRAAAASAPLLLALSLTACGGDDATSAPDDASAEDFCSVFLEQSGEAAADDAKAQLDEVRELADNLGEVGTPAEFSAEAREGFEVFLDFVANLDEEAVDDFNNAADPSDIFGGDDAEKVAAFTTEAASACIPEMGDLEGELGDLEDQLPSDFPS
ncbi:MAG: hypothetical protein WB471_03005 [Nocardioides sp.]